MTTRDELSHWFDRGVRDRQAFMLVYCDTFDNSDYPVYAENADGCLAILNDETYSVKNMQRLMEVYDLSLDKEMQLAEHRAIHFPTKLALWEKTNG